MVRCGPVRGDGLDHGMVGSIWVAMGTIAGLGSVDRSAYDAARIERGDGAALWFVALPLSLPATLVSIAMVAATAACEMTVADLYTVRTLADAVYLWYSYDPQPLPIALAAITPLAVAVPTMIFAWRKFAPTRNDVSTQRIVWGEQKFAFWTRASAVLFLLFSGMLAIGMPIFSLLVKSGWTVTMQGGERVIGWSLQRCWRFHDRSP
ncbi:MAG: hypothetical protein AAFN70_13710, partial [Planctomycetota bacterium]